MTILEQALDKINTIKKPQKEFFKILIQGLIGIAGRRTFRNLARYLQIDEHTFSRHMKKAFDFIGLNAELIKANKEDGDILIAAQDASFISKSGKSTEGLDYFWNGCAGKAEKGLELDAIAIVKINGYKKDGFTISAQQTAADPVPKKEKTKKKKTDLTRIDSYLNHLKMVASKLINLGIKHIAVDCFLSKKKYIDGAIESGLYIVSKLRKDARLLKLYNGPQKSRGRKKKFEPGKVTLEDFSDSVVTKIEDETDAIELRSKTIYSVALGREIKVVQVRKYIGENKIGEVFLFSTDLEIYDATIYLYYTSRFQIEFIFRDAKGFTGLADCQSRNTNRLNYHFNTSLLALNVAKLQDIQEQKKQQTQHAFSIINGARKYHVEIVLNRFISMLGLDLTLIKLRPDYEDMLAFGNITH